MKLAKEMRVLFQNSFPQPLTVADLTRETGFVGKGQPKKVATAIRDFVKRGEVEKTDIDGTPAYRYVRRQSAPNKKQVMWRLLRARRRVSIEDLQELADVGEVHARKWISNLEDLEIVKKRQPNPNEPAFWHLINDTVVEPETSQCAERLRLLRANKKAAKQLDAARSALASVRMSIDVALKELDDARRECEEGNKS